MKLTIHRLAMSVADMASTIDDLSASMPAECGICEAEVVINLRDAVQHLNKAKDYMQMSIARAADEQRTTK